MLRVDKRYAIAYDMSMLTDLRKLVTLDRRANAASVAVLGTPGATDLDLPTPCADWRLRDLLAHMTTQHHGFAAAARGNGADEESWRPRPLGEDPVAAYAASVADVDAAFEALTDADGLVLPEMGTREPFPAVQALSFHLVDGIVHAWDLTRTLDVTVDLDAEVLDAGWQVAATVPDDERRLAPESPFARAVPVADDAPVLDRIVAALGRSPSWSAARRG